MSDLLYQQRFSIMVARLLLQAAHLGFNVTLGHAYRCEECPVGSKGSFHKRRLAIDLNLFTPATNKYLTGVEDYRKLGQWWESIGGTWGGNFKTGAVGDANHFSLGEK